MCHICSKEFERLNGLAKHIHHSHSDISREEYYKKYISDVDPICECGKHKKFRGLHEGYRRFCSIKCLNLNEDVRKSRVMAQKGRKQSSTTIEKRILHTDQNKKQETNRNTIIRKYGVENVGKLLETKEKIRNKSIGRKRPRTDEHQKRIIESKRQNNTLKHSESTKAKMSRALLTYTQTGDDQTLSITKTPTNGRGHKTGFYNGILYRSSYELIFILFCAKYKIELEYAENIMRRVRYVYNGKKHWYYPDFYLPKLDICIEIKPKSMMNELFEVKKEFAEKVYRCYAVLTEDQLFDEKTLYEYIFTRRKCESCSEISM